MPILLKQKWQMATWTAAFDSVTNEANNAVHVVPRFAPNVKGSICSKLMIDKPTNGVKTDVVIELDWTDIVNNIPNKIEM